MSVNYAIAGECNEKLKTHSASIPLLIATFSTLRQMFLLYCYKSASGFRNQRIEATKIVLLM